MDDGVDISGLDKVELLHRLWQASTPAMFFAAKRVPPPDFSREVAEKAVTDYIDYFAGRLIKMDLSEDRIHPFCYDREFGQGSVAQIVADLRAESIK